MERAVEREELRRLDEAHVRACRRLGLAGPGSAKRRTARRACRGQRPHSRPSRARRPTPRGHSPHRAPTARRSSKMPLPRAAAGGGAPPPCRVRASRASARPSRRAWCELPRGSFHDGRRRRPREPPRASAAAAGEDERVRVREPAGRRGGAGRAARARAEAVRRPGAQARQGRAPPRRARPARGRQGRRAPPRDAVLDRGERGVGGKARRQGAHARQGRDRYAAGSRRLPGPCRALVPPADCAPEAGSGLIREAEAGRARARATHARVGARARPGERGACAAGRRALRRAPPRRGGRRPPRLAPEPRAGPDPPPQPPPRRRSRRGDHLHQREEQAL